MRLRSCRRARRRWGDHGAAETTLLLASKPLAGPLSVRTDVLNALKICVKRAAQTFRKFDTDAALRKLGSRLLARPSAWAPGPLLGIDKQTFDSLGTRVRPADLRLGQTRTVRLNHGRSAGPYPRARQQDRRKHLGPASFDAAPVDRPVSRRRRALLG